MIFPELSIAARLRLSLSLIAATTSPVIALVYVGLTMSVSPLCVAQGTTGQNATGTKPYWSYLKDREVISPGSGNMIIKIPLLHLPGRDGHDLNLEIVYNSQSDFNLNTQIIPKSLNTPAYPIMQYESAGAKWSLGTPAVTGGGGGFVTSPNGGMSGGCYGGGAMSADGAVYSFGMATWGCSGAGAPTTSNPIAADDSLAGVIIDGTATFGPTQWGPAGTVAPTVYFPNGDRLVGIYNVGTLDVDPNGNYITYDYANSTITDTLGRVVTIVPGSSQGEYFYPKVIKYYNSEGIQETITINYGPYPAAAAVTLPPPTGITFGTSPGSAQWVGNVPINDTLEASMISSIVFPDGSSYSSNTTESVICSRSAIQVAVTRATPMRFSPGSIQPLRLPAGTTL